MMSNCIVGSAAYYQSRTMDASQAGTSKSARKRNNKKKSSSPTEDPKPPSPDPINDVDAALGSLYRHMTLTLP
jgi:hypothetical protein